MFGGDADESFTQQANIGPSNTYAKPNDKPLISGGLFGGNALKDDEEGNGTSKGKLGGIFDYGDSDEERKSKMIHNAMP